MICHGPSLINKIELPFLKKNVLTAQAMWVAIQR